MHRTEAYLYHFRGCFLNGGQKRLARNPCGKQLMSNVELEEPRRITDQVYLGCTQRVSETNRTHVTGTVRPTEQSGFAQYKHDHEVQQRHQAQHYVRELRHAGSWTEVR